MIHSAAFKPFRAGDNGLVSDSQSHRAGKEYAALSINTEQTPEPYRPEFRSIDLGLVDFPKAWDFQKEIFVKVRSFLFDSAFILCRHYPVVTSGRRADKNNLLISREELRNKGIPLYEIERGGDLTYHGPGQMIVYPIFNLGFFKKDIHWFLRRLEKVTIDFLLDFGIKGQSRVGFTGVWVDGKKISSIGIAIKNWITFHGLSINIKKDDLANFKLIRPCGMDIEMTALEEVLGRQIEIDAIKNNLLRKIREGICDDQGSFAGIRRGD